MVGLGRMGSSLVRRSMADGHRCIAYDSDPGLVRKMDSEGAIPASSLFEVVSSLSSPRVIWLMVPAGATGGVVNELRELLDPGDILVDGGNSNFRETIQRGRFLAEHGIHYVDIGTSGGVHGYERGFCLMVGAEEQAFAAIEPLLRSLAPGQDSAPRTAGRIGEYAQEERGYLLCGKTGAGHFVKMVHNGIEYGMMAAMAEGFNLLAHANVGLRDSEISAETAPLSDSDEYEFNFDLAKVAELWRRGSVVSSWLLDLTSEALYESPQLEGFTGRVSDSGEGRWAVQTAVDVGVPVPVLSAALFARFASRDNDHLARQVLSAMRSRFGGHDELKIASDPSS